MLETVQQKDTKMIHIPYEEKLRELEFFSLGKYQISRRIERSVINIYVWKVKVFFLH